MNTFGHASFNLEFCLNEYIHVFSGIQMMDNMNKIFDLVYNYWIAIIHS